MSFGNRGTSRPQSPSVNGGRTSTRPVVANRGSGRDRRPGGDGMFGGDADGAAMWVVGGAGVFVALVAAFLFVPTLMNGSSSAAVPLRKIEIPAGPIGLMQDVIYRQLPAAQFERSAMTEKLMATCLPPLNARTQRALGRDPGFQRRLAKLGGSSIRGLGRYITCSMRTSPDRFCQSQEAKADLIAELTVYFAIGHRKQKDWDKFFGPNAKVPKMQRQMMALAQKIDGKKVRRRPRRPADPRPEVVHAMRGMFENGYFAKSDFGWSIPSDLKPYLKDIEVTGAACG